MHCLCLNIDEPANRPMTALSIFHSNRLLVGLHLLSRCRQSPVVRKGDRTVKATVYASHSRIKFHGRSSTRRKWLRRRLHFRSSRSVRE